MDSVEENGREQGSRGNEYIELKRKRRKPKGGKVKEEK